MEGLLAVGAGVFSSSPGVGHRYRNKFAPWIFTTLPGSRSTAGTVPFFQDTAIVKPSPGSRLRVVTARYSVPSAWMTL